MTEQPTNARRRLTDHYDEFAAAGLCLMIEQGYMDQDGYVTPLGEQYISALKQEGETQTFDVPLPIPPPPIAPKPLGAAIEGMSWSDAHSDF